MASAPQALGNVELETIAYVQSDTGRSQEAALRGNHIDGSVAQFQTEIELVDGHPNPPHLRVGAAAEAHAMEASDQTEIELVDGHPNRPQLRVGAGAEADAMEAPDQEEHPIDRFVLDDSRIEIGVQVGEPGGGSEFMLLELQAEDDAFAQERATSPAEPYVLVPGGGSQQRRGRKRTLESRDDNSDSALSKPKGICQHEDCTQEVNSRAKRCPEHSTAKRCTYEGPEGICMRVARGSDPYCITHGGGRRCRLPGCNKSARGKESFCKAHGGGRRCHQEGCTKSAEGKSEYCHTHGGGTRCTVEGCIKAARGATGLCISHGGGKRCQHPGCPKGAEGKTDYCIGHGGGVRCSVDGCPKSARGRAQYCIAHGGGIRCAIDGCEKSAQGATQYCIGHGGGTRCKVDGCDKGARGASGLCVAHGGGRRCEIEGCDKGAEGRSGLCIGHGGGHRCQQDGCDKPTRGRQEFCKNHRDQRLVESALNKIRSSRQRMPETPGSHLTEYEEAYQGFPEGPQSQAGTPGYNPSVIGPQIQWQAAAEGVAPIVGGPYIAVSAFVPPGQSEGRNYEHVGSEFIQENQAYVVGEHEYVHSDTPQGGIYRPGFAGEGESAVDHSNAADVQAPGGADEGLEAPPMAASTAMGEFVDQSLGLGAAPPIVISMTITEPGEGGEGVVQESGMVAPPIVQTESQLERQARDVLEAAPRYASMTNSL